MKIISRFKDFYDRYSYQYGVDESIKYYRDFIDPSKNDITFIDYTVFKSYPHKGRFTVLPDVERRYNPKYLIKYVSVLGELYPVIAERIYNEINCCRFKDVLVEVANFDSIPKYFDDIEDVAAYSIVTCRKRKDNIFQMVEDLHLLTHKHERKEYSKEQMKKDLINAHRDLRAPIFTITPENEYGGGVYNRIPNLSEIKGFVGMYGDGDKLYREIYNFFSDLNNQCRIEPPVGISNTDKIHKAGFDNKISFRNRKTA